MLKLNPRPVRIARAFAALVLACCALSAAGRAPTAEELNMGKMQLFFLEQVGDDLNAGLESQQKALLERLLLEKKIAAAGPLSEGGSNHSLVLVKTDDAAEAKALVATLPLVKAGQLKPNHITWFAARNYVKPVSKIEGETRYVFGLLVSAGATGHTPEQLKEIQAGHMAHINKMAGTGKLVLAGPFANPDARRGVFLFKLDTREEAAKLAADDPAIQAGRLKLETFFWIVPTGIFP